MARRSDFRCQKSAKYASFLQILSNFDKKLKVLTQISQIFADFLLFFADFDTISRSFEKGREGIRRRQRLWRDKQRYKEKQV